jgi:hypothetical protein
VAPRRVSISGVKPRGYRSAVCDRGKKDGETADGKIKSTLCLRFVFMAIRLFDCTFGCQPAGFIDRHGLHMHGFERYRRLRRIPATPPEINL